MRHTKGRVVRIRRDNEGYHVCSVKNEVLAGPFCDDWILATGLELEIGFECEIIISVKARTERPISEPEMRELRTDRVWPATMTGRLPLGSNPPPRQIVGRRPDMMVIDDLGTPMPPQSPGIRRERWNAVRQAAIADAFINLPTIPINGEDDEPRDD